MSQYKNVYVCLYVCELGGGVRGEDTQQAATIAKCNRGNDVSSWLTRKEASCACDVNSVDNKHILSDLLCILGKFEIN